MQDMLAKLYDLPDSSPLLERLAGQGVQVRRALRLEQPVIHDWVNERFSRRWAAECDVALTREPIAAFVAVDNGRMIGFACYDATLRGFFGPMGVDEAARGRGIGQALLLVTLEAMAAVGYGYAIIGAAGPDGFYRKTVGATAIEGSNPGVYRGAMWG